MTKFNVGDKVRYLGGLSDMCIEDITEGKTYEIVGTDRNGTAYYLDDKGETWCIPSHSFAYYELVTEQPVEASPSVIELLSNLALRLMKVEADIKPKDDNDRPTQAESVDNVNSPQHYRHGRFETIELIEDITKKYDDGFVAYCVGNAVKYVDRAPFKHGSPSEDLRKAAWYLTRAAEHTDATTPPST